MFRNSNNDRRGEPGYNTTTRLRKRDRADGSVERAENGVRAENRMDGM